MRKGLHVILLAVMIFTATLVCPPSLAASDSGLDVVILIDRSGSMKTNDPSDIAQEAAKQFIDLCQIDNTSVAVVGFNHEITVASDFIKVDSEGNRTQLKTIVDQMPKSQSLSREDTDTGRALQKAWELIDGRRQSYPDNQYVILLVSDGVIDFGTTVARDDADNQVRIGDSKAIADDIAYRCGNDGVEIYCIGLKSASASGSSKREDLEKWASDTNGLCEVVEYATELPDVLTRFFEKINESQVIEIQGINNEFAFFVPVNVLETNIVVSPGQDLRYVQLVNPNGENLNILQDSRIMASNSSDAYKSIKLIQPITGDWMIRFPEEYGDIKVTMVNNFDLNISITASTTNTYRNQPVELGMVATRQNQPFDGTGTEATFYITGPGGTEQHAALYDAVRGGYYVTVSMADAGEYTARGTIMTQVKLNESDEVSITILDRPLSVRADADIPGDFYEIGALLPSDEIMFAGSLDGLFYDDDGDPYTVAVQVDAPNIVEVIRDGDALKLRGLIEGQTDVHIVATSQYGGGSATIIRRIIVKDMMMTYIIIAACALAALIIIIVVIVIIAKASKPAFMRQSAIQITLADSIEGRVTDTAFLQRYNKKKVRLSDLTKQLIGSNQQFGGYGKQLSELWIIPAKNGIRIVGSADRRKINSFMGLDTVKVITLDEGAGRSVEIQYTHYTY